MFSDHGYYMGGMHAFWWILLPLMVLLFVILLRPGLPGRRPETPRELLRRRLAAGELAPDEYEQRMALLNRDC